MYARIAHPWSYLLSWSHQEQAWHEVISLQWRHNGHDSVSNHQPHNCLLNRSFRRRSKKTSKLRVTGLCEGNSPVTGEFPAQMANNAENVSIWWRHHGLRATAERHSDMASDLIAILGSSEAGTVAFMGAWNRQRHSYNVTKKDNFPLGSIGNLNAWWIRFWPKQQNSYIWATFGKNNGDLHHYWLNAVSQCGRSKQERIEYHDPDSARYLSPEKRSYKTYGGVIPRWQFRSQHSEILLH